MRIAGVEPESVVDGPGVRFAVFTQGCELHCPGCHNPETWAADGGCEMAVPRLIELMDGAVLAGGLTLSGGEASRQPAGCAALARHAHWIGWDVWCWSGHTVEFLLRRARREQSRGNGAPAEMLSQIDVLVDGPFLLSRRTLGLAWRGSDNQRLIDMPATLERGRAVEWRPPEGSLAGSSGGDAVRAGEWWA